MLGRPATEETFRGAADAELAAAAPLRHNAFKVPLVSNVVTAVLAQLAGGVQPPSAPPARLRHDQADRPRGSQ